MSHHDNDKHFMRAKVDTFILYMCSPVGDCWNNFGTTNVIK